MTHTQPTDTQMEDLLNSITEALFNEDCDLDEIISRYEIPRNSVDSFIELIHGLRLSLKPAQPSNEFVKSLKKELVGKESSDVFSRLRGMPGRVQIAAGIALVAGFLLISRRRILGEDEALQNQVDVPILQQ